MPTRPPQHHLAAPRTKADRDRDHDRRRTEAQPWRAWYRTARWAAARQRVFERDLYRCQMSGCGVLIMNPRLRVCDHRVPHRGDAALFWADDNLQTLCKPCHDIAKQAQEHAGFERGCDEHGRPRDTRHPWNRA